MAVHRVPLCLLVLLTWCTYGRSYDQPVIGVDTEVSYNASGDFRGFKGVGGTGDVPSPEGEYFISELNFEAIDGKVLVGAADQLYLLDMELSLSGPTLPWETEQGKSCTDSDKDYVCRNHIRVYKKSAADDNLLLVCGTQSTVDPECRSVSISGGVLGEAFDPSKVENLGIISRHPDLPSFTEFRNDNVSDTTYFSATLGPSLKFSISYQNVTIDSNGSSPNEVVTTELFRTIDANKNWLRAPVTFVDYYRVDYPVIDTGFPPSYYQFYFVFLRENLFEDSASPVDIVFSRVVRICRNDQGSSQATGNAHHFLTYLKARIYCETKVPPLTAFDGALNYQYNNIRSVAFNEQGRLNEGGDWSRLMYGAFSGPLIGPDGSALCVYSAEDGDANDGNGGIFDIFQEDITDTVAGNKRFEGCIPDGREDDDARDHVLLSKDVEQLGDDPIMLLDDMIVTQMVVDRVCVVKRDDGSKCVNQDVLFLGTDQGKVMKVFFNDVGDDHIQPITAEEIMLDDDNLITNMELKEYMMVKYLYLSSVTKIYRIPLERCSRHRSCSVCVGSRDPYCVWDTSDRLCKYAQELSAAADGQGTVPDMLYQNVTTGEVSVCEPPTVWFEPTAYTVNEDAKMVQVTVRTDTPGLPGGYVQLYTMATTATAGADFVDITKSNAQDISFEEGQNSVTVSLVVVDDDDQEKVVPEFLVKLIAASASRPVSIDPNTAEATVTIIDDDDVVKNATLVVNPPGAVSSECDDCIEQSTFDAVVGVTVTILIILVIVVLVLVFILLRNRQKVGISNLCNRGSEGKKADAEHGKPPLNSQNSVASTHPLLSIRTSGGGHSPTGGVIESPVDLTDAPRLQFQGPPDEHKYEEPRESMKKAEACKQSQGADGTRQAPGAQPYQEPVTHSTQGIPVTANAAYTSSQPRDSVSATAPWSEEMVSPTETFDSGLPDRSPNGIKSSSSKVDTHLQDDHLQNSHVATDL